MSSLPSYRRIWSVSWPLIIGLLAENIVGVIDTAFLGHVSDLDLAASAIAGTFYVIMFVVGMGLGTGTQILIARRNGEKKYDKIGGIFENSLYLVWVFSVAVIVISFIFSRNILGFMLNSEEILDAAMRYLDIRVFTLFFALGCVVMRSFFVGVQFTRYISIGAFIVAGTNFILDYLLIFGKFGFPKMGIEGAALASVFAEVVGFAYFIYIIVKKINLAKYNMFTFKNPQLKVISQTMSLSVFTMLQNLLSLSSWFLFFVIIEKTGEKNLAASNIIRSYYILAICPLWAYGSAVSTLVSNAIGAKQRRYVFRIIRRVTVLCLITSIIAFIPTLVSARGIMSLYTDNIELVEIGFKAFYVVGIANILSSVAWTIFSVISATGNTMIALFVETFAIVCYLASVYYFAIKFHNRVEIIWCSENVYQIVLGVLSILYLRTNHWTKKEI
ncbi:MAG: MATE family efflux transporter [Bacteroidales bacterium]|jgi:putative MATE family efflux protein|nr:MATE family efflux transporter [Bacteroidales bacterium]